MSVDIISPKMAKKRYMARMAGASLGYIGSVIGAAFLIDSGDPITPLTLMAAIIPAIFIIMMLAAVWRYVADVDEVARHDYVQAMLLALFGILALSGSWGLIELFHEGLPRVPVFWVFPIFFGIFGFVSCFRFSRIV